MDVYGKQRMLMHAKNLILKSKCFVLACRIEYYYILCYKVEQIFHYKCGPFRFSAKYRISVDHRHLMKMVYIPKYFVCHDLFTVKLYFEKPIPSSKNRSSNNKLNIHSL